MRTNLRCTMKSEPLPYRPNPHAPIDAKATRSIRSRPRADKVEEHQSTSSGGAATTSTTRRCKLPRMNTFTHSYSGTSTLLLVRRPSAFKHCRRSPSVDLLRPSGVSCFLFCGLSAEAVHQRRHCPCTQQQRYPRTVQAHPYRYAAYQDRQSGNYKRVGARGADVLAKSTT